MLKEIYAKDPQDIAYQDNIIDHSDAYEAALSKIRMILYTKPGEVLGDPNFGVNLEEYVFALNASNKTIENSIQEQIIRYVPESEFMDISVSVSFQQGNTHDICYIDIKLNGTPAMGIILS